MSWILWLLFCCSFPGHVRALFNRTFDDTLGDDSGSASITFNGNWQSVSGGGPNHFNVSAINNGTFHQYVTGSGPANFTFTFVGSGVYVYFIMPEPSAPGLGEYSEFNFTLDGGDSGAAPFDTNLPEDMVHYNVLVFKIPAMPNGTHTLTGTLLGRPDDPGNTKNHLILDYIVYTSREDEVPSRQSTSSGTTPTQGSGSETQTTKKGAPIGAIVGGVLGGVALLAIIFLIFLILLRKRRKERDGCETPDPLPLPSADHINPFHSPIDETPPQSRAQTKREMMLASSTAAATGGSASVPELPRTDSGLTGSASATGSSDRAEARPLKPRPVGPEMTSDEIRPTSSDSSAVLGELVSLRREMAELREHVTGAPPQYPDGAV